jgi:hypothetical protein
VPPCLLVSAASSVGGEAMLAATPRADSAQYIEAAGILIADSDVPHFQAQEPGHRTKQRALERKCLMDQRCEQTSPRAARGSSI